MPSWRVLEACAGHRCPNSETAELLDAKAGFKNKNKAQRASSATPILQDQSLAIPDQLLNNYITSFPLYTQALCPVIYSVTALGLQRSCAHEPKNQSKRKNIRRNDLLLQTFWIQKMPAYILHALFIPFLCFKLLSIALACLQGRHRENQTV